MYKPYKLLTSIFFINILDVLHIESLIVTYVTSPCNSVTIM